jgi:hypothetical protein
MECCVFDWLPTPKSSCFTGPTEEYLYRQRLLLVINMKFLSMSMVTISYIFFLQYLY